MDNYWDALALAKQQAKPLLVHFTSNCLTCDSLNQVLKQPNIEKLSKKYIRVRLSIDDPTPIDSMLYDKMFPEKAMSVQSPKNGLNILKKIFTTLFETPNK